MSNGVRLFAVAVVLVSSLTLTPLAAADKPEERILTVLRVLIGRPVAAEAGPARISVIPGPFVFLGKSPEEEARDVLQLMGALKKNYGLAEVSIGATSSEWLQLRKETEIAMPLGNVRIGVTPLYIDATQAAYSIRVTKHGEEPSEAKVTIVRGERGLMGTRDGDEAPYIFLTIEPLSSSAQEAKGQDGKGPAVMPAELVQRVQPVYPPDAWKAGIDGVVVLEARIGIDGQVHDLKALRSEPMGLTEAAIEAVKQWRYKPASDANGKPLDVFLTVTISFALDHPVQQKPTK
jgi:TonB family protein